MEAMETSLLSELAKHGLLAILLAISWFAIYKLFDKYEKIQEKRAEEGLAYAEKMADAWKTVEGMQAERAELINALTVLRRTLESRSLV